MTNRAIENKCRNTVVCIDSYHEKIMRGRIYNPYIEENIEFYGLMSFILAMEELMGQMSYPMAYEVKRSFTQTEPYQYPTGQTSVDSKGAKGTFIVRVLFRHNASWQGTICWKEGGMEESFRSVLELVILINSALQEGIACQPEI